MRSRPYEVIVVFKDGSMVGMRFETFDEALSCSERFSGVASVLLHEHADHYPAVSCSRHNVVVALLSALGLIALLTAIALAVCGVAIPGVFEVR